jgi:hypothetical protein
MKSAIEILTEVRELLSEPGRWTQYASARNVSGDPVPPHSDEAVCFCAVGAFYKVGYPDSADPKKGNGYWAARQLVDDSRSDNRSLITLNDSYGRDAVLEVLDRAIEAAV